MAYYCIHVALMSGKSVEISVCSEALLEYVKLQAQTGLHTGRADLLNSSGQLLATHQTVGEAGVKEGDVLTLQLRQTSVAAAGNRMGRAFAAVLCDSSVKTWGSADHGGDCSAVREQLKTVRQIKANSNAFAAILDSGHVVTWGTSMFGGDAGRC